jgi:2-dehydro-3-deoxyphosphooctonate aldolase (KDO 8-P synthase)
VLTDVHDAAQCAPVAEAVDVLQIPAFLCRQTDLLLAAAATRPCDQHQEGPVPRALGHEERIGQGHRRGQSAGHADERGASFGYNTLVSDMRSLPIMKEIGCPVVFDATHSVQQPGGQGTILGRPARVRAGAGARRCRGRRGRVFIETHPDPDNAPSDGPNMVPLSEFEGLIANLLEYDALTKRVAA